MGTAERRAEIMKILCRRRRESIRNLAAEFGVSSRTIQRDVDILSRSEPIFTMPGRYGGVCVVEGYSMDRMYMTPAEVAVLQKLYAAAESSAGLLTLPEKDLLGSLIAQYSKPTRKNERNLS